MPAAAPTQSYSQYGQDRFVLETLLGHKTGGTFIEIGAFDGVSLSNTVLLEKSFGWTGICIEALPEQFEKLKSNRNCICIQAAATDTSGGEIEFQSLSGASAMLSGRPDLYARSHTLRIAGEQRRLGTSASVIRVPTVRASEVLRQHDLRMIDYASIDVEGGEFEALKGLLAPDIRIGIIGIENNYSSRGPHEFLLAHGYKRIAKLGSDDFYRLAEDCTAADLSAARSFWFRHWRAEFKNFKRRLRVR